MRIVKKTDRINQNHLYRDKECSSLRLYRKISIGTGRFTGMYLWQPVKKILFFYIPDRKREPFWLDDSTFEKWQP